MSTHSNKNNKKKDFIDVKGTIALYARNWYWFLISLVLCGVVAYVAIKKFPQKVQVRSSILVTQDAGTLSMMNGLGGLLGADPYVQDEIFVITSHSVLCNVAKNLGTNKRHWVKTGFLTKKFEYPTFPVDVHTEPAILDTLQATICFKVKVHTDHTADVEAIVKHTTVAEENGAALPATINTPYGQFIVNTTDTYSDAEDVKTWIYVTGYHSAAEDLAEEVSPVIASKKSNVIELNLVTENADFGIDVLNDIMKVYNELGIEERNKRATKTAAFIKERLDIIAADLNAAEADIEQYKEDNRLVDIQAETAYNTQIKSEMERRLISAETGQEILKMTIDFISNPENKYELLPSQFTNMDGSSGGNDNAASSAMGTYNDLVLRRMTLLNQAKPGNRTVVELEQQIAAMRSNIITALERQLKNNTVTIAELRAKANAAQSKLGNVPTQERQFINLKRQQQVKQELYLFLLQRSEETAMLIANAVPKGQIIDQAFALRDPVGMSKWAMLAIALFMGFFIPILCMYIKRVLRTRIESRQDVENASGLPILGEMCIDRSGDSVVVGTDRTSSASELFRMIRTNLGFVLANPDDKVVMVTSSVSGEGKSFISVNLSASLALLGKKVILVGMDIRCPQLASYLSLPSTPGLTQYLSNHNMTVAELTRPLESTPGLDVIVAGPVPPNPGELMTSPRLGTLIEELRKNYDYVVLDTAPVSMVSDTFNLTRYADATIYVVRIKKTRLQDLRFLADIARDERLKRVNIVVNGSSTKSGYGYGYQKK